MLETFACQHCGRSLPITRRILFDGQELCDTCFDEQTACCERCGDRIWLEDNAGNSSMVLCQECFDDSYHICAECGTIIHEEDTYYIHDNDNTPYCHRCIEHRSGEGIQSYYFKPVPIFHGEGLRFMGVELEIDRGGEYDDNADQVSAVANRDAENLYIKHDGSLNEGMELVSDLKMLTRIYDHTSPETLRTALEKKIKREDVQ